MQNQIKVWQVILSVGIVGLLFVGGCKKKTGVMATNSDNETGETVPLDPAVTSELFLAWRSPRLGTSNPQRMNNPVWEWLIRSGVDAYHATKRLNGPSAVYAGPGWCFDRFGQSTNQLADGRLVFIAGEHEDHYDPDFYIYNDVVVQHPDGRLDIFGYTHEDFPPTDFHSATLVSNRIVLIGNLGYPDDRRPGETPVRSLDLETFAISRVKTSGTPPGWIHGHRATLSDDRRSILIERGQLDRGGKDRSLVENIDDWRLHLGDWRWERLTERRWPRWEVRRKDGKPNHLFDYHQALWAKQFPEFAKPGHELTRLKEELGKSPDLDVFAQLYKPSIAHHEMAMSEVEYNVHRILVEGVVVRYVDDMDSIQMTVEGELPQMVLEALASDLLEKLAKLENSPCELIRL